MLDVVSCLPLFVVVPMADISTSVAALMPILFPVHRKSKINLTPPRALALSNHSIRRIQPADRRFRGRTAPHVWRRHPRIAAFAK